MFPASRMTSALWTPSAPDIGRISTTLEKSAATRLVASASSCATARSTLSANAARGGSAAPTPKAVADLNTPRRETKGEGSSSEQAATSTTWSILRTEAQHRRVVPRTTNAIGTATIARADDRRRSRWRMRADRTVTVYFYNRQTRGATRLSSGTSVLRDTHVTRGNRVYRGAIQLTRVRARSRWPHWLPPSRADRLPTPPTNQPKYRQYPSRHPPRGGLGGVQICTGPAFLRRIIHRHESAEPMPEHIHGTPGHAAFLPHSRNGASRVAFLFRGAIWMCDDLGVGVGGAWYPDRCAHLLERHGVTLLDQRRPLCML